MCMIAFFSIFWWNGVSIDYVFDRGVEHWNEQAADLTIGNCVVVNGANTRCRVLNRDEQVNIYYQAQSAWYITLIMCQFWHIWVCKTRQVSIFEHGFFSNLATVWGVSISIPVMVLIVYAPFLQGIFSTANMVGIGWVPQLGFLLLFVPYTEYSKYLARKDPDGWWATHMQW
jgi:magnesium-transporting ATPase (P-type)